jgi:hypothetical protein
MKKSASHVSRRGASLLEALIGIAVGSILIVSGISLLTVSLRVNGQNKYLQAASYLGSDLMTKVSAYVDRKWLCVEGATTSEIPGCGIYNLTKGEANHYQIVTSASFISKVGDETNLVDETAYTRYFYVENVSRDTSGNIESTYNPATEDPSTQKVTVVVIWPGGGKIENVKYFTRTKNNVLHQTDWSGGLSEEIFPATDVNNKFYTSQSNIDTDTFGSIKVAGF